MMRLTDYKNKLETHNLLTSDCIKSLGDLRIFMEYHVFAVWDFMSLAKSLQHHVCPSGDVWLPSYRQRKLSRLINEIILAEESDEDINGQDFVSHFDLYVQAMEEVGANTGPILNFIEEVRRSGIDYALEKCQMPEPSRAFMKTNFDVIATKQPHLVASVFAHGRETVIPAMFKRIVSQVSDLNSPKFIYYLERHIAVDGDDHGPKSLELVNVLCDYDDKKQEQATDAAINAIQARINFWDGVEGALLNQKQ